MPAGLKRKEKKDFSSKKSLASTGPRGKVYPMPVRKTSEHSALQPIWLGRRNVVICLLLVAATLAAYGPVMRHPFVNYDDDVYVTQNEHVQSGLSWSTIQWAFSSDVINWHPLTWLSHALDWQLFATHAGGHHFTSVLIHAFNAALLFFLLLWATGREKASLLAALLFALHPINVESVAWIAERKNVLSTLFFLAALAAYGWYAQRPGWRRYFAVAGLFVAGLMSKPMVITLPFVLLLLDYWPLGRVQGSTPGPLRVPQKSLAKLVIEKLPLFALALASAIITMQTQSAGGAVRSALQLSLGVRLENALVAYPTYLWKMLWPVRLAVLYPHPGDTLKAWQLIWSAVFLLGITAVACAFRRKRYLLVGWLWFLGTLVPVIGLVQVGDAALADRYAYIPLIGIFVMLVWGLSDLSDALHVTIPLRIVPATCVLLALALAAHRQIGYWSNSENLWAHTLAVTKDNLIAHRNLASAMTAVGKPDEAFEQFKAEAALNPHDMLSQLAIGAYLYHKGRLPEALAQFEKMTHLTAERQPLSAAFAGMGMAYADMEKDGNAYLSFERSLRLNPNQPEAYHGLGRLAEKDGRLDEAVFAYSRLAEIAPTGVNYQRLGDAFRLANRPTEALNAYQNALKISPEMKDSLAPAMSALGAADKSH
jgi:protein O-mannosyl-transferase